MSIDPESLALLQQLAEAGAKPFHEMQPGEARAFLATLRPAYGEGPAMERVEETTLGAGEAAFGLRVLVPSENVRGVIVHFHGGGWVTMSIDDFDTFGRLLARKTNCAVILVDYRLAPEHPYPAALDDCWLALQWADNQRARLASADAPLMVSGDSAGGNLAAVLAQRSVRVGSPRLALQILIYPVTQSNLEGKSYCKAENQLLLTREDMRWFWGHYQPQASLRETPECSPLNASDLAGLPPLILVTAEYDVLRDEGEAYGRAMRIAGCDVTERCFERQMHVFLTMINILSASAEGINFVADQITIRLNNTAV